MRYYQGLFLYDSRKYVENYNGNEFKLVYIFNDEIN